MTNPAPVKTFGQTLEDALTIAFAQTAETVVDPDKASYTEKKEYIGYILANHYTKAINRALKRALVRKLEANLTRLKVELDKGQ